MFRSLDDFHPLWAEEVRWTTETLGHLTDESLAFDAGADIRSLGRLAWHLAQTIPEMSHRVGLRVDGPAEHVAVPDSTDAIRAAYETAAESLGRAVRAQWTDADLLVEDEMYGERWTRATTLRVLVMHQAHHRGQMTVLMRQAGLRVPGIYGPAKEDWARWGMQPPAI